MQGLSSGNRHMNSQTDSDPLVRFTDVSLGYGDFTVLQGIDLEVRRGQVVAMMGGSGSGKTTLLRAATGQITAQKGSIQVFGKDIAALSGEGLREVRQRMGVLFQQGALFTDLNVFENVAFPLREHTQVRSEEHTSELQSLMRISYAVFCLK